MGNAGASRGHLPAEERPEEPGLLRPFSRQRSRLVSVSGDDFAIDHTRRFIQKGEGVVGGGHIARAVRQRQGASIRQNQTAWTQRFLGQRLFDAECLDHILGSRWARRRARLTG